MLGGNVAILLRFMINSIFRGAGDAAIAMLSLGWTPTWLNVVGFWLWEIPLACFLAGPGGLGPQGVFIAIAVAFSTLSVASALVFRRGRWKTRTA